MVVKKLVQFSAAQGPLECSLAVENAVQNFIGQLESRRIVYELLEKIEDKVGLKSLLLSLELKRDDPLISTWEGTHQWIWQSRIRPKYPRKNWFFGVAFFDYPKEIPDGEIHYKAISASGPGGQHVNKTASAIQATHLATGIAVKVQTERSQHANKRLAKLLIQQKLTEISDQSLSDSQKERRLKHHQLVRGEPQQIFEGDAFKLRTR